MLKICLTFDHEIHFGENYASLDEVLFKPTEEILEILKDTATRATFFTDVCSVFRHSELGLNDYVNKMNNQLCDLMRQNQDIQLHIHSHWYNSTFQNNRWEFDKKSFRIHSFGFDRKNNKLNASKIISDGKKYLVDLLTPINNDYRCIAFRGGGYSIQPEHELFDVLIKNQILIDSTVLKGMESLSDANYFSFKKVPKELNWWMSPLSGINTAVDKNINEHIFEVPVGTYGKLPYKWYFSKLNKPFKSPNWKGIGMSANKPKLSFVQKRLNRIMGIWNNPIFFSLDNYHERVLVGIIGRYLKDYDCLNNNYYVSTIAHPKSMSSESIDNLGNFIRKIKKTYPSVEFVTMADIYNDIIENKDK